jgi:hypothetical protein
MVLPHIIVYMHFFTGVAPESGKSERWNRQDDSGGTADWPRRVNQGRERAEGGSLCRPEVIG